MTFTNSVAAGKEQTAEPNKGMECRGFTVGMGVWRIGGVRSVACSGPGSQISHIQGASTPLAHLL